MNFYSFKREDAYNHQYETFGKWYVLEYAGVHITPCGHPRYMWNCQCSGCNKIKKIDGGSLRSGATTGCMACFLKEHTVPEEKRICKWCGKPHCKKSPYVCEACDRVRHRRGVYECGKPMRTVVLKAPINEHNCEKCKPWKRPYTRCETCGADTTVIRTKECSSCRGRRRRR